MSAANGYQTRVSRENVRTARSAQCRVRPRAGCEGRRRSGFRRRLVAAGGEEERAPGLPCTTAGSAASPQLPVWREDVAARSACCDRGALVFLSAFPSVLRRQAAPHRPAIARRGRVCATRLSNRACVPCARSAHSRCGPLPVGVLWGSTGVCGNGAAFKVVHARRSRNQSCGLVSGQVGVQGDGA